MTSEMSEIYVIRSATSHGLAKGQVGEESRSLEAKGHREKVALGTHLIDIIGQHPLEVRFAPANRTRLTAMGAIGLTYSSVSLQRDVDLTETDPDRIRTYLECIVKNDTSPIVLFTHLDVVQAMVYAICGEQLTEDDIPTASITRIIGNDPLEIDYVGRSVEQLVAHAR